MQNNREKKDVRLIEAGFPCHQVGAETQRERGASSALPPLYYLHVWWARRPLAPSRAAILGSLLPADTDPEWFLRQLGIEKVQALVNGEPWILEEKLVEQVEIGSDENQWLLVDEVVLRALQKEHGRRTANLERIKVLKQTDSVHSRDPVLLRWEKENQPLPGPLPKEGEMLPVTRCGADPYWAKQRIAWENERGIRTKEDKYGYPRAFKRAACCVLPEDQQLTIFDPTAGGGSIPFEALRLGHKVIANDLNPVAAVILYATLDYPLRFGSELTNDIKRWGKLLRDRMLNRMGDLFPASPLRGEELDKLKEHLHNSSKEMLMKYNMEELDGFLYARQVTCPQCGGEAPLLNSCWLSKEGQQWGVRIIPDGGKKGGKVRFDTYRAKKGRGPRGEDPNLATVSNAVGTCIHCRQAISADEIKSQARGESPYGKWKDRLYCVVAVRYQPKLNNKGEPQRFKSGPKAGEIKLEKIRFFRPPNERDLNALTEAEKRVKELWPIYEQQGIIPTEKIPNGHKTKEPLRVGMTCWCDMFTPR